MGTHSHGTRDTVRRVLAWDGEGWETDGKHVYGFLANSDGYEASDMAGLSTFRCLSFLCDCGKNRLNVIFSGHYDVTLMLKDLTPEQAHAAMKDDEDGQGFGRGVYWNGFKIRYVPRKYLYVRRVDEEKGMMLWDVWGFFQGSFLEALEKWFGPSYPELQLIYEGKVRRSEFKPGDMDFIRKYNNAELQALVRLIETLITASEEVGLHLSRFDGAGAVAASMLKLHGIKERVFRTPENEKVRLPVDMRLPAEIAYYGGRVECFQYGHAEDTVYHYDINSAYPAVLIDLPNIGRGTWEHLDNPTFSRCPEMSLFRVKWDVGNEIICPFPYRSRLQKKILFPSRGESWVWYPEVFAALNARKPDWKIEISEAWIFHPEDFDDKPYSFIGDYYQRRAEMVKEKNGAEKVLKLGLNSLYGKTAQRVGAKPFHSLAYAGYITSATRAKLYTAGMQAPHAVLSFATDGIFSLAPLNLYCPAEKELGAWEFKKHDGMTLVQSGYYILKDGENLRLWSRGFLKFSGEGLTESDRKRDYQEKIREHVAILCTAWKNDEEKVVLSARRFMGLKIALVGDNFKNLGQFFEIPRDLKIFPQDTKRETDMSLPQSNPAAGMVHTTPTENYSFGEMSAPYRVPDEEPEARALKMENLIQE